MDDLALLEEMADRTPLPSAADLAPARARLTAALTSPATPLSTTGPTNPATPPSTTELTSSATPPTTTGPTSPTTPPTTTELTNPATTPPEAELTGSTPPLTTTEPTNPATPPTTAGPTGSTTTPPEARRRPVNGHSFRPSREDEQMTTHIKPPQSRHDPVTSAVDKPRRGRRRLVVSAVTVVGLAAAITGVVALGGLEQVGVAPPKADAAEILHQAADAARDQPFTPPRPDQFIYTKLQGADGYVHESWLSADGTRDGLVVQAGENTPVPGCRDGQAAVIKGTEPIPGMFEPCEPLPTYLADAPTDAAGMRTYVEQLGGGPANPNSVGKNILYFSDHYVSPQAMAALYDALATFPGLTVAENATDGAGRQGTGISWTVDGLSEDGKPGKITNTLVFDSKTHAYLGTSDTSAVVVRGVVDAVGQQP